MKTLTTCVSVLALVLTGAVAAQTTTTQTTAEQENPATYTQLSYEGRVGDLLGKTIVNSNDEEIGEIDDLLIDADHQVTQAILSVGGFLGLGDKLVAVPFDQLELKYLDDELRVIYPATQEQLEAQAAFEYKQGEMTWNQRMAQRAEQRERRQHAERLAMADAIDLTTWDQAELYSGWRANDLLDVEVRGDNGEVIGEVENIVVNEDGSIQDLIIEVGGILGIGETPLAIDWKQVTVDEHLAYVQVPVSEESVDEFSLFDDENEIKTGPRAWRVSKFMGDYVSLKDGVRYGVVDDLIFSKDGQLIAVVVTPALRGGPVGHYAYPYYGYEQRYDRVTEAYQLPYERSEIMNLEPFDYSAMKIRKKAPDASQ